MHIHKSLPTWMAPALSIFFAILWGVWLLPETVFIRHAAMISGSILGLYVCINNRNLFFKKEAIPIYVILLLIGWITLHYFYEGTNHALQLKELTGVWKKVTVCISFAIGLGIAIGQSKQKILCWNIFYIGLTLPTLLYFGKWLLTHTANEWNIQSPYLLLNPDYSMPFGISRALYSFYCLPSFVMAVFLMMNFSAGFLKLAPIYLTSIFLTPLLFFLESDKTGLLLSSLSFFIAILISLMKNLKKINLQFLSAMIISCILFGSIFFAFTKEFKQWKSIVNNSIISIDVDNHQSWKYHDVRGLPKLPKNENGEEIDSSNYARIAWFVVGLRLLHENPMGYGLLTLSFDHLSKYKWPDSTLSMTHSGFLDFALGYGYLGIGLLLIASFGAMRNSYSFPTNWNMLFWGFVVLVLVMFMKELSYEITVNAYIFLILLMSGMAISFYAKNSPEAIQ